MVQLLINGNPIALSEDQSFSFTKSNSLFSKDSSFSYDIKVSLENSMNARVFGPIAHKSVTQIGDTYKAQLIADGRTILKGSAKITSIDADSVSIQLVDRDTTQWKSLYIDELNIGRVINFQTLGYELGVERINNPQDFTRWIGESDPNDFIIEAHIDQTYGDGIAEQTAQAAFEDENQDEHFIGIHYEDIKAILNYRNYNFNREIYFTTVEIANKSTDTATLANWMYPVPKGETVEWVIHGTTNNFIREYEMFAPQMKLYYVVEKVFEAVGCKIGYNFLKKDRQLSVVLLANATVTNILSHTLPHWTIEQFIKEVENFASVIFEFDGDTVNIRQMVKKDELSIGAVELDVISRFTKKIDNIRQKAYSLSYDIETNDKNKYDYIPDDIVSQCKFVDCADFADIETQYAKGENRRSNVIFRTPSGAWYFKDSVNKTILINEFRNSSTEGTVLKLGIKPVALYKATIGGKGYLRIYNDGAIEKYTVADKTLSLEKYFGRQIEKEERQTSDVMKVTIFEGRILYVPIVYNSSEQLIVNYGISSWNVRSSLCLWRKDSAVSHERFDIAEYDPNTIYTYYFVADVMPDVKSIFFVEGKKYFAKSITCEIKSDHCSRLYKGEFLQIL